MKIYSISVNKNGAIVFNTVNGTSYSVVSILIEGKPASIAEAVDLLLNKGMRGDYDPIKKEMSIR